jgi:hypothetical protein
MAGSIPGNILAQKSLDVLDSLNFERPDKFLKRAEIFNIALLSTLNVRIERARSFLLSRPYTLDFKLS